MKPLSPPPVMTITDTRERILSMGGPGAGKTFDFFAIARMAAETGSDAHFYVIDTDESSGMVLIDPALKSLWKEDMSGLSNVTVIKVSHWDDLLATLTELQGELRQGKFVTQGKIRKQDWLMIDLLSPTWQWCQDWYTRRVFHLGLDEFFLQQRESMKPSDKKMNGLEGWKDYTIINPQYALLQDRILRSPGNVYATAEIKALNVEQADKETKLTFGPYGVSPVGQKRTPHVFSTIVWKTWPSVNEREGISVKDRGGRVMMQGKKITDFAKDYLIGVAGWSGGKTPQEILEEAKAAAAAKASA